MRKKSIIIFLCLILIAILALRLGFYFINYSITVKANWGIWLPRGFKEIYSTDSGPSFFGDGERYHVFYYRKGLKEKDLNKLNPNRNASLETDVEKIIKSLQVPDNYRPDFTEEYYWYYQDDKDDPRDKLYIIYFVRYNKMYIVEEFY